MKASYNNTECDRCSAPKPAGTWSLWCEDCNGLPACEDCGEPCEDCGGDCGDYDGPTDAQERAWERRQMGITC